MPVKGSEGGEGDTGRGHREGTRWEEPEQEENRAGSPDVTARGAPRESSFHFTGQSCKIRKYLRAQISSQLCPPYTGVVFPALFPPGGAQGGAVLLSPGQRTECKKQLENAGSSWPQQELLQQQSSGTAEHAGREKPPWSSCWR